MAKSKAKPLAGMVTIDLTQDLTNLTTEKETLTLASQQIQVVDDDSMNAAAQMVARCAAILKAIDKSKVSENKAMAHRLHKSLSTQVNEAKKPFEDARELLEGKIVPYRLTQKAELAAQEQELSEEAERVRKDLLSKATKLRKQGRIADAQRLEEQAEHLMSPILADAAPEIEGVSERTPWKAEIIDPMALIIAIAEGRVPLVHQIIVAGETREEPLVYFNHKVLDYLARTRMKDFDVPGAKAYTDLQLAVRGN